MTKKELIAKISAIEPITEQQKKELVCTLIGHSNIITTYFGYIYCGRCNAQIGDSLGGIYDNPKAVIIGHNCETCQANYKIATWEDKFLTPNPFIEEEIK